MKKFISTVISILLFFVLIGYTGLYLVSNFYDKDYYTQIFKDIDLSTIQLKDIGIEEEGTVEDYIVSELNEIGIEEEVTKNILNNDEIKEVVGEFIADYVNYTSTGENMPKVTRDDVEIILNNEDVKNAMPKDLTDKEINELINQVNDAIKNNLGGES